MNLFRTAVRAGGNPGRATSCAVGVERGMAVVRIRTCCTLWMLLDSRLRGNDGVECGGWLAVAQQCKDLF